MEYDYSPNHQQENQTQSVLNAVYEERSCEADFLSFRLANELYGVAIRDVEEIRVWEAPTPIPRAPSFVKGVINLRGMIVPIIDLRLRFDMAACDYLSTTVVLVLRSMQQDRPRIMGLVVDAVSDVIGQGDNVLFPAVGETTAAAYSLGLLNVGEEVMSLLDTQGLLDMHRILSEEP
ncbi:chemotaxis protein CheW [Vibrio qinghaiensis]|jgi:purine-binding chemotaxis protein CheW|uniref:Chemotaxis protein CheW n=1 Tax=Vibrio qinghaiensis TaxID=2025808 RepID=A0A223N3I4_9VIBR|nr:chemotaxis protein CheW [Vibrio qinghaiensis]ASU23592.1 chemotaxis protein CheW [Vibrio qinghaiensis]ASU24472.1 chemotaxis protein CheW [Vibrio qinghaiensis]